MSKDPYHDVKREVENTISHCHSLLSSFLRLNSQSNSASTSSHAQLIAEAKQDLVGTLQILDADLEDLEESVLAVEEMGEVWGVEAAEVGARREFLERVKREVKQIRQQSSPAGPSPSSSSFQEISLSNTTPHARNPSNSLAAPSNFHSSSYADDPEQYREPGGRRSKEVDDWEQEQQELIMRQQDSALDVIGGTLRTLAEQAGLIGQEVGEQNEMLDDLSTRVDSTDSRLSRANKRLKEFIRKNEETRSGWCIGILIVILIILLLLVIIT